ncbi:MAG TPA: glycosyltransferase family 4 protein [Gemmatimonadales bacterium]|nr:glycosyltransferase family 4 protein [Gemmatimonadales bacterium]
MKLAVFTSWYPARITTFFERDMRALVEAGVELEVFVIGPLDASMWSNTLDLLGPQHLPRNRVHHLTIPASIVPALRTLVRHPLLSVADAWKVLSAAARQGRGPFAKSAYVFPKAWAWASQYGDSGGGRGRFDHVLAYWGNYAGTCAYAFHRLTEARSKRRIPFSIWMHAGIDLYRDPIFLREKLLYADNIITCCEFNQEFMAQLFPDAQRQIMAKVHVCHHGLDLARFPFRTDGRAPNRVIAVGRLRKHKGFDYLIRAAAVLAERGRDITVELVGDGSERENLRDLAAELGILERVELRGWLSNADVMRAMSEAAVLVHPSEGLGDGLPNVVREAMAVGTPVIGSNVAGIPDALQDGCGVLVPPRDVAALADALDQLLADPQKRHDIATHARARVADHYDLWRNGARLAHLLESTRRGKRQSPAAGVPLAEPSPQC